MTPEDLLDQVDLEVIRGDNAIFDVVIKDAAGQSVNLQGGTLRFTARTKSDGDTEVIAKSSAVMGEVTFTDAIHGMAALELVPGDTTDLYAPSTLVYDFEFEASGGKKTTVLPAGILYVQRDITRGV